MRNTILLALLIALVLYVILRSNKQVAAATAALKAYIPSTTQTGNTGSNVYTPTTGNSGNPDATSGPVNYLDSYLNA